jgi:serine protease Do
MKKRINSGIKPFILVAVAVGMLVMTTPMDAGAAKSDSSYMVPANFSQLAEDARPGVVNIRTVKTIKDGGRVFRHFYGSPFKGGPGGRDLLEEFFGPFYNNSPQRDYKQRSLGSGFIIDQEGYIVTNNHVVEDADQIKVKLYDEQEFDAKIVGRDPNTDLALIKIEGARKLMPLKMGNSVELAVGTWVVAIGSPFGLEQTVTAGIVSAKGRIIGSGPYDDFIQTDASINPGNSGGPLLNMAGEVVGINTAIVASGHGIGFAIPVDLAKGIISQLKEGGEVTRGWLGVAIQDLTPQLAEYYGLTGKKGVLVTQVFKDDPADKVGLQSNDVITAVDDKPVITGRELSTLIANTRVGKRTKITYYRDGDKYNVDVTLTKRMEDDVQARRETDSGDDLGLHVTELAPDVMRQFGIDESETGVLVTRVMNGSKADEAGIQPGDIIKEVNRSPVSDIRDYNRKVAKVKRGESLDFLIQRRNEGYMAVRIKP